MMAMRHGDDGDAAWRRLGDSGAATWCRDDGSAATATARDRTAAGKRDVAGGSPRCAKMEVISQKKKS
ncbi:hypothetical protein LINPERPRIM_LOCUS22261, partial [Linum perenne]